MPSLCLRGEDGWIIGDLYARIYHKATDIQNCMPFYSAYLCHILVRNVPYSLFGWVYQLPTSSIAIDKELKWRCILEGWREMGFPRVGQFILNRTAYNNNSFIFQTIFLES